MRPVFGLNMTSALSAGWPLKTKTPETGTVSDWVQPKTQAVNNAAAKNFRLMCCAYPGAIGCGARASALRRVGNRIAGFNRGQRPIRRSIDVVRDEANAGVAHREIGPRGVQAEEAIVPLPRRGKLLELVDPFAIVQRQRTGRHGRVLVVPP